MSERSSAVTLWIQHRLLGLGAERGVAANLPVAMNRTEPFFPAHGHCHKPPQTAHATIVTARAKTISERDVGALEAIDNRYLPRSSLFPDRCNPAQIGAEMHESQPLQFLPAYPQLRQPNQSTIPVNLRRNQQFRISIQPDCRICEPKWQLYTNTPRLPHRTKAHAHCDSTVIMV